MARLPVPGSDDGQWGELLNDFLLQAHDAGGALKPDAVSPSSLQDASVTNTKLSLSGGSDGQVLARKAAALGGFEWASPSSGQVYPIEEGYGFHSASVSPDSGRSSSYFSGWQTRVWVPAHKTITKAGIFITAAATGTASLAGFGIYSDDGQTLLGQATDSGAFLSVGLPEITLATPIASQPTGRFVRVLLTADYSGDSPDCVYMIDGGPIQGVVLNGGPAIRSAYFNALSSFPASFDPVTGAGLGGWTLTNYLPILFLG